MVRKERVCVISWVLGGPCCMVGPAPPRSPPPRMLSKTFWGEKSGVYKSMQVTVHLQQGTQLTRVTEGFEAKIADS